MNKEYLNNDHLVGFENYKYSCKDTSPLSQYVMHPFWNKIILLCPRWIAPNLLTFSGFLFTFATLLLLSYYDYDFYANARDHPEVDPIPNWVFMTSAIFLFLAYTLDGIDGKQARRTGTSGPLGELFDHGLDSYTAAIIPIVMFSIFGRSDVYSINAMRMFFIVWNVLINFYLTHWEKYNTGLLFLPWGYDFSMWCTILTFLLAGIFGYEIWQFTLPGGMSAGGCFEILLYVSSMVSNVPIVFYNVYMSYKLRTGHMRSFAEAARPLFSVTIFFLLTLLWACASPTLLEKDPRALFFLTGTIFSNICCRLIVAQMSNTRCDLYNSLITPTAVFVAVSLIVGIELVELLLIYFLCFIAFFTHIHYGSCVVQQMCKHFHIRCFKIPYESHSE
ncbi:PREDICTED: ethanolaminephosphotransferase 1-like [Nicrophorus vespilloides]|uniref:Ethanolaminephosphotransferase 1-like n=1 Tax=Nicrophorus vespilloides TaxID=110193 RepID=A0ABM1M7M1_NICVS|nr:PREDICTED: ethanolaminephosphotransferase 1-like [Nicrophorus vespilloides]